MYILPKPNSMTQGLLAPIYIWVKGLGFAECPVQARKRAPHFQKTPVWSLGLRREDFVEGLLLAELLSEKDSPLGFNRVLG